MLEKCWEELGRGENARENLSQLRSALKQEECRQEILAYVGDGDKIVEFLTSQEPKVRKNAALLLGDLKLQSEAAALFESYQKEETLFVKSAYLIALQKLDASLYTEQFKARLAELSAYVPADNEKKHVAEELQQLEKLITAVEGIEHHKFSGFSGEQRFLLTTNREQREVTMAEVEGLSALVKRSARLHPLGVLVKSRQLMPFTKLRTYRELLFCIPVKERVPKEPEKAADAVWNAGIYEMLAECMEGGEVFYFRLDIKSRMELDKKTVFAKRFGRRMGELSGRKLVNSVKEYEIELRLFETKEGDFLPFLRIPSLTAKRFSYRRHAVSASIHPSLAAMLVSLAKPYLKENAQILDPFCGVGTMLIERDILVPAREKYGIDIFGDAITYARENAAAAGEQINFIHRDYFDFRHAYLFDEIITNMPMRGKKTKEEMDEFYRRFFEKSKQVLTKGGTIVLYANEIGFIKKQLRIRRDYKLLQEFVIREKEQFHLFIIETV